MNDALKDFEAELLDVPVTQEFEHALGYFGASRYIAVFWEQCGDEFRITDGRASFDGCWHAWLQFKGHPRCAPVFERLATRGILLGDSETMPTHYCVLDREARKLYILPRVDDIKLISRQYHHYMVHSAPPLIMGSPMMEKMAEEGMRYAKEVSTDPEFRGKGAECIHDILRREQERVLAMIAELDAAP